MAWVGHDGDGFAFDNEGPRHQEFVQPFELASRLVTNGEYLAFMADGGYQRPEFWLSEGWGTVQAHGWQAPLYWEQQDGQWWQFTLAGMRPVEDAEPVCHVSYSRPTLTRAGPARACRPRPNGKSPRRACPGRATSSRRAVSTPPPRRRRRPARCQMFGDVWEWTRSQYTPYPGFKPAAGRARRVQRQVHVQPVRAARRLVRDLGDHIRPTYRNFFPPDARWQFMGVRLAKDV